MMPEMRHFVLSLGFFILSGCAAPEPSFESRLATFKAGGDVIGGMKVYEASREDTLIELARPNKLGFLELAVANPEVDPWLPGAGTKVVLPTAHVLPPGPREGLVINLAEQRLYHFNGAEVPTTYPIGVGREGWDTPLGSTEVVRKRKDPTWHPPASARREDPSLPRSVPPGPDNPLGSHALYLGWAAYLVHGTNEPYGIGRRVSRGCIRLYPEDIARLYDAVPNGTPVHVLDEPVKLGRANGELFLEVHPSLSQAAQIEETGRFDEEALPAIESRIVAAAGGAADRLDWKAIKSALRNRQGVPVQVTRSPEPPPPPDILDFIDSVTDGLLSEEAL